MPAQAPPPQEYARVILIIVLLFFIYTSPDQGTPPGFASPRDYAAERIARSRHALDVLNITKWQDFSPKSAVPTPGESARYLNLTGFQRGDEFAWERLDTFKRRSEEFGEETKRRWRFGKDGKVGLKGRVYENVTGVVKGKWVRYSQDLVGERRKRHMNLTETSPHIDWAYRSEEFWTRNITGLEGNMMLHVDDIEREIDNTQPDLGPMDSVRGIEATMTIQDDSSSGDGWEMRLHGVHWPKQGVMYMTTTSEKFAGIFGLPHLTTNEGYYITSQKYLNRTLENTIERMERVLWREINNPWSSTPETQGDSTNPAPHCEFVVFAQVQPIKVDHSRDSYLQTVDVVEKIEQELRYPNGAPIPMPPKLQMSTVMFSPDCGFMLESKGPPTYSPVDGQHLVGKKQESWLRGIQKWLNGLALVILGQILLLKIQSKEASTPSTVGRVSLFTVAIMLMADALLFSSMSLLSALAPHLFPSALLASFAGLMSVGLGVRFIGAVYNVQEPERRERLRAQHAARAANTPAQPTPTPTPITVITAAGADTVPPSSTTASAAPSAPNIPPIIIPSDQDIDAEIAEATNAAAGVPLPTMNRPATAQPQLRTSQSFGAIYAKFVLTLTMILFLSLSAHGWSVSWRNGYSNLLAFIYLSFWVPQIHRNVVRNCRKALLWKFVIGQSILRLLPIAYFYLMEDNILFAENDWRAFSVLAGWIWVQVWILIGQEVLGPRWGLPKSWYEEGWDYHPILREDNVEAGGLPIGLVQMPSSPTLERTRTGEEDLGSRKKKDGSIRTVDCAICMQVLEVPVVGAGEDASSTGAAGGMAGMLARRLYMVTPCRHVFHSPCLEGWMRFRLQCPICRENLPPL